MTEQFADEKYSHLTLLSHQWQADILVSMLEQAGIAAIQQPSTSMSSLGLPGGAGEGIEVWVPTDSLEEAQVVRDETDLERPSPTGLFESEDEEYFDLEEERPDAELETPEAEVEGVVEEDIPEDEIDPYDEEDE